MCGGESENFGENVFKKIQYDSSLKSGKIKFFKTGLFLHFSCVVGTLLMVIVAGRISLIDCIIKENRLIIEQI